ncbi:Stigma-specific Stig1 family protein [Perilla frutescens var. hirtella]|nr:Stigma-specific Stig1 family protein [Perilla frutescens var. hirtella]
MKVIKLTLAIIAITMALTLILTANNSPPPPSPPSKPAATATARVSRFLQQKGRNPNAADHCNKDREICSYILDNGRNATTCCNNKCVDLGEDDKNCGACKKKCAFTETCCRGECVLIAFDKRHCGACNHRCMEGGYCIYGLCDYA